MKFPDLNSPQVVMALLVRRKWWIVFPFLALSCAALLLTFILPRMYVSESLILIQPRDVPTDFVKDLIAGSTAQRLSAIEQTVLSRGNLVKIVQEFEGSIPTRLEDQRKANLEAADRFVTESDLREVPRQPEELSGITIDNFQIFTFFGENKPEAA